jgi:iron complex outermembrane receptor protein
VARTVEAGVRGHARRAGLTVGYDVTGFRTESSNDILFISSGLVANQGYFANVGETLRQGIEAELTGRQRAGGGSHLEWALNYTLTDATFQSAFTELSATHPDRDPMTNLLSVPRGAHIPSIPRHVAKVGVTYVAASGLSVGANLVANSSQYYRGDEANLLSPVPGYFIVNARAAYQVWAPLSVFVLVDNVLNTQYSTFGVLGDATDVFPNYMDPRFLGPGAPRAAWAGVDLRL